MGFLDFFRGTPTPPQEVELTVLGKPISQYADQFVTYDLGNDNAVTCELKRGQLKMIHHLFSNEKDANDFLEFVQTPKFKQEFPDIQNARITNLQQRPHHAYPNSTKFLIRLSDAQFKSLFENHHGILKNPDLDIPPSLRTR